VNTPSPGGVFAAGRQAEPGEVTPGACDRAAPGHYYDARELRSGTPEYEAGYAEYQAWAGQAGPENEPVPYTLTDQAQAALDAGEAEPEAEP
jgi:hypothetical protein